eukprot:2354402-Pleurochrysis_carterae.AAC.1
MHLTLDKILRTTQAASKHLQQVSRRYVSKVLVYKTSHVPCDVVKVACICPSPSRLAPLIKRIEDRLGVVPAEDDWLGFKSYMAVVQELLMQDLGAGEMPALNLRRYRHLLRRGPI